MAKEVKVAIVGDSKELDTAVDKADTKLSSFGKAAAIGVAGIGAAFAGAIVGLEKIGSTFDDQFDKIRTTTGQTGEALAGLEQSFRDVVSSVPTDFDAASTAIAGLNQRLGLTGEELEERSAQFIRLSQITGTDLQTSIDSVTRVFGDWGVATADQGKVMDELFRASQVTGTGVDKLAEQVVTFGAPLRQMGFSFEESIGLLGKFEKEGVNTELVMGSLRIALGKLSKSNADLDANFISAQEATEKYNEALAKFGPNSLEAQEALLKVQERDAKLQMSLKSSDVPEAFRQQVEAIKMAGSTAEANTMAMQLFGAKAGPDMAAAIREGRFELGDLLGQITGGTDTIMGAAAETDDWREKLQLLKNKAMVQLEPVANAVFGGITSAIEKVTPHIETFANGVDAMIAAFKEGDVTSDGFIGKMEQIGVFARDVADVFQERVFPAFAKVGEFLVEDFLPVLVDIGKWIAGNKPVLIGLSVAIGTALVSAFLGWAAAATVAAIATLAAWAPIIAGVALFAALVAGIVYAYNEFGWFRETVDAVAGFLKNTLLPILKDIGEWIVEDLVPAVVEIAKKVGEFGAKVIEVATPIVQFVAGIVEAWVKLQIRIAEVVAAVIGKIIGFRDEAANVASKVGEVVGDIVGFFVDLHKKAVEFITPVIGFIVDVGVKAGEMAASVGTAIGNIIEWFRGLAGKIGGFAGEVTGAAKDIGQAILSGIGDGLGGVVEFAEDIGDAVWGAFEKAWNKFVNLLNEGTPNKIAIKGLPDIPLPDNPWSFLKLAEGGIVTGPTLALIGEAGPEAVIPLGAPAAMPFMGGAGGDIYVTVNAGMGTNGAEVGRQVVLAIQSYERRNGPGWRAA